MSGWQFFFYIGGFITFSFILGVGIVLALHAVFGL